MSITCDYGDKHASRRLITNMILSWLKVGLRLKIPDRLIAEELYLIHIAGGIRG